MKIIPGSHKGMKSKKVETLSQIEHHAVILRDFATNGRFIGEHLSCIGLHHAQVCVPGDGFNFFALSERGEVLCPQFPSWCIINPQILKYSLSGLGDPMTYRPMEGCMSWPFRKSKKVDRHWKIQTRFWIPYGGKMKQIEQEFDGLQAQVFQHEYDHGRGKTICD